MEREQKPGRFGEAGDVVDFSQVDVLGGAASFTLGNRLRRAVWSLAWTVLAAWTPAPLHRWRGFLLRLFGARIDKTAHVYPSVSIWDPRKLRVEAHAGLGRRVICYNMAEIHIGEGAVVSQGAHLCAGTHLVDDPNFQLVAHPIRIGAKAWIATEAFVGPGVVVGEGAVLGARGVTVKDLADWTIYVGNPARAIRQRGH